MRDHTHSDATDDPDEQPPCAMTDGGSSRSDLTLDHSLTSAGFFEALSEDRLVGGRCQDCDAVLLPPRPICNECGGSDVVAEDLPKEGTIVTHTNIHKTAPVFDDLAPLAVAIVELDSTGRFPARVEAPYDEISIGDRVRVEQREPTDADREFALDHEEDWPLPVFVPVDE
ncbi:Zn-ribbon domain-containing OB-fold protein [Natrinema gelatinilyticum]|uniref:Zn-ribbon domain-containing OB-fold protein n=1 Tax=Natrinema gelatinilyticum TaxID=2961571 RepID=UPI0020C3E931|nr:Zn-ribbon domain-containing OB-fold protein [Natrinema gelatinilyticum]